MTELEKPPTGQLVPWYFKTRFVLLMLFIFGPFALPLVWFTPQFSTRWKVITTILAVVLTVLLVQATSQMFQFLTERLKEIKDASIA